jgi:hypothetical protein
MIIFVENFSAMIPLLPIGLTRETKCEGAGSQVAGRAEIVFVEKILHSARLEAEILQPEGSYAGFK